MSFNAESTGKAGLTARELDVAGLLVCGRSNEQIAAELNISARTVYSHIDSIKQKLGVSDRADLLHYIREHGLNETNC